MTDENGVNRDWSAANDVDVIERVICGSIMLTDADLNLVGPVRDLSRLIAERIVALRNGHPDAITMAFASTAIPPGGES